MTTGSIWVFGMGALFGVFVSVAILGLLKKNRIIEKKTDPLYYKSFSNKKKNMIKVHDYCEKRGKITTIEAGFYIDSVLHHQARIPGALPGLRCPTI